MNKSLESNIRIKAVLIYIVVAAICCGMIAYFYNLRENIDSQRKNIEHYQDVLSLTNEFIYTINQAQLQANLYISSKNYTHLREFRKTINEIELLTDSFSTVYETVLQDSILKEINGLLVQKGRIVSQLNTEFSKQDIITIPVRENPEVIEEPEIEINKDTIVSVVTIQDTLITTPPKKNFWKRLGNVFSPDNSIDTIITINTIQTDTLKIIQSDTTSIAAEISSFAEQSTQQYTKQITTIERQVTRLITTDQEISTQIFDLLSALYHEIIDSTLIQIEESEEIIRKNYTLSIGAAITSLMLILLLIIFIIRDVNKGYAARRALEEANERTREIMESRHKLLLSVSHDIKTPLNSILGYLELAEKGQSLTIQEISSIQNSGKYILALVENLLGFSSLEQGTLKVNYSLFNLWQMCMEIVNLFEPLASRKNLSFEWDIQVKRNVLLYSDQVKIKQVLINVLSNSFKYTQQGKVSFRVSYTNKNLICEIGDTGVGIPKEKMNMLFQPFTRIDENNSIAEGSGFGLYVVKGLIELLGGNINIESEAGTGTLTSIQVNANYKLDNTKYINKNILVIDDDISFLKMTKDMLLKLGHTVTTFSDAVNIDTITKNIDSYDLVLTDMELGNTTGTDILKTIKSHYPNLPVFVMTGKGDFGNTDAQRLGFDGYLQKPFSMASLSIVTGNNNTKIKDTYQLDSIEEICGGDKLAICEILETFIDSTKENIHSLKKSMETDDFNTAQSICHKMLAMFMQLKAENCIPVLKKMDSMKGKEKNEYPQWKQDINTLITNTNRLINELRKDYFTD